MTTLTSNNSDVIRYTKKERDFLQKKKYNFKIFYNLEEIKKK